MADVVFIVGAGASVHAGAPIMSNFLDRARDLLAAGEVDDRRAEFQTAFRAISFLQRVHSKARLDHNNIESVFSAVDLARTLQKLPGLEPAEIEGALKALVWLIVRTLEQSIKFETRGGRFAGTVDYRTFAGLIDEVRNRTPPLSVAVLTFNYDIAMDLTFAAENIHYDYGLSSGGGGVPLLKLHGSLNWGRLKDETRGIVPYDLHHYIANYRLQWFQGDKNPNVSARITQDAMEQLRKQLKAVEDEPVLVPPTWSKGEHHRAIGKVWSRAAEELAGAQYIFVIGYSLPETDQFFRLLFGLGTEGQSILKRVAVFDPSPEPVRKRFLDMLGHGALDRFSVHAEPFGMALSTMAGILFESGKRRSR